MDSGNWKTGFDLSGIGASRKKVCKFAVSGHFEKVLQKTPDKRVKATAIKHLLLGRLIRDVFSKLEFNIYL